MYGTIFLRTLGARILIRAPRGAPKKRGHKPTTKIQNLGGTYATTRIAEIRRRDGAGRTVCACCESGHGNRQSRRGRRQNRSAGSGCGSHTLPAVEAVGPSGQCRWRSQTQERSSQGRVDRIRRPHPAARSHQGHRAPGRRGQGRLDRGTIRHRLQRGRGTDFCQARLPADPGRLRYRTRSATGQEISAAVLRQRHAHRLFHAPRNQHPQEVPGERPDRQQGRHGQYRRRVRHRNLQHQQDAVPVGRLRNRLQQILPARHPGSVAGHQGREGDQSGRVHRLVLSAGHIRL